MVSKNFKKIPAIICLLGAAQFCMAVSGHGEERITFRTDDGFIIAGRWIPPAPSKKTLVLLHGFGSGKDEWNDFAELIHSRGYGVFVYDARGHGESANKIYGDTVTYNLFYGYGMSSDWGRMVDDLALAVKVLKEEKKVNPRSIALCGASLGANVAFRYAAQNKDVPYLILLSPGIDYRGVTLHEFIPAFSRPLLMAASPGDDYAYKSVSYIQSNLRPNNRITFFIEPKEAGHGVQMFRRVTAGKNSELEEKVLKWMEQR